MVQLPGGGSFQRSLAIQLGQGPRASLWWYMQILRTAIYLLVVVPFLNELPHSTHIYIYIYFESSSSPVPVPDPSSFGRSSRSPSLPASWSREGLSPSDGSPLMRCPALFLLLLLLLSPYYYYYCPPQTITSSTRPCRCGLCSIFDVKAFPSFSWPFCCCCCCCCQWWRWQGHSRSITVKDTRWWM